MQNWELKQLWQRLPHKRIGLHVVAAVAVVSLVAAIGQQRHEAGSAATTIFIPTSFWNTPIPANTPLNPNSQIYAANLKRQVSQYYNSANINTTDYAASVYTVPAGTVTQKVGFNDCQGKGHTPTGVLEQWAAVPIPSHAVPAGGTDKEMVIYQPSTDTMWEFWVMEKRTTGWFACWGGKMTNVSKSDGIWPYPWGTTATGLPFIGGQISIAEAQAGSIDHAIGMSLVEVQAGRHSWPANRNDGWINDPNAIPEGLRFRLDPAVNVETLNLSAYGKMMARAMQKYGVVIWDKAGSVSFRGENPTPYIQAGQPNPYDRLFEGKAGWQILGSENFPWDKMQALPFDYGKPGTIAADTTPPTISLTAPAAGSTVSGTISVTANASDNVLVSKVELSVDGVLKSTDTGAPYSLPLDTQTFSNGSHVLLMKATDPSGNATSSSMTVNVQNVAVPVVQRISQTNNLATGKHFSSSSGAVSTYETLKVNDGNEQSRWISEPVDGTVLGTDLGAHHTFAKISILWAGDTTRNYSVQMSKDTVTWTTVATGTTNNTSPQLIDTVTFSSPAAGRYVRIVGHDRWNTAYGHSIYEIGLYQATTIPGDSNNDKRVNAIDLSVILSRDGQNYPAADFNGDGTVGAADMAILLGKWTW